MKAKHFAVKKGTKTGIFYSTWDIAQSYVLGYPHAIYRAFENIGIRHANSILLLIERKGKARFY